MNIERLVLSSPERKLRRHYEIRVELEKNPIPVDWSFIVHDNDNQPLRILNGPRTRLLAQLAGRLRVETDPIWQDYLARIFTMIGRLPPHETPVFVIRSIGDQTECFLETFVPGGESSELRVHASQLPS